MGRREWVKGQKEKGLKESKRNVKITDRERV
jgi:hypothetical protein